MLKRTWPYGTTRRAHVKSAEGGVLVLLDEKGEGHLLMGTGSDPAKAGDWGTLTFTQGGPNGGYWRFTQDQPKGETE